MSCDLSLSVYRTYRPPLFSFFAHRHCLQTMPTKTKKDPRDKVGAIIHAVANRALSDHTAKNIFGTVNYAKHFMQGTAVKVFDGRAPGGKNAIWKLTVDFEMPSDDPGAEVELKRVDIHCQHCILGPVPAGKNPPCSVTFTDSIGDPDHAVKGSSTYLPNAEARAAAVPAIASVEANAAAPHVLLSPSPCVAATAEDEIEVVLPAMDADPTAVVGKTKRKRKKATLSDDASTATPPPPTAPAAKKSKGTKKKKASETVDLREKPVWVVPTDGKRHRVVAIAHDQKWIAGNAKTVIGHGFMAGNIAR
jgi:hypothetical protein